LEGTVDADFVLLADEERAVVIGVGQGIAEDLLFMAPVGDGVAVDAGFFGGLGQGGAAGQGVDDCELLGVEGGSDHRSHFLLSS